MGDGPPGTSVAPKNRQEFDMTLYTEIGGEQAIGAALDLFYHKVLADPQVSVYFDGLDVEEIKKKQRAFLAMAFGGPSAYTGRDLRSAHALPRKRGLDEVGFETFMGHFRDTLAELGVPEPKVAEIMSIAYGGKDDVLARG
jgi:hemoglobin